MTMKNHVKSTCRSAFFQLLKISKIKKYLDNDSLKTVIQACVTSRLDYGNALLNGTTATNIKLLQQVQNSAARMLTGTKRTDHITPVLKSLHWLPVEHRITFKTLSIAYSALNDENSPAYIKDMLHHYQPTRALRSADDKLLHVPKTKTKMGE
ncbi:uncharacterized protein LOC124265237, partial [Haliotis rubra]|uniref:uncharacterized protein LOC124265237 n=1 Tax=Haliotis rubra TaxID=36100 RepID=UPI001EE504EF